MNFNDPHLKQGLLDVGVDKDHNGNLSLGEIYFYNGNLDLSNRNITDLTGLENAYTLKWLDLSDNSITDPSVLGKLFNLEYLDISNNKISDKSFEFYSYAITQIRTLNMKGNRVTSITFVKEMPWLVNLDISENLITDITSLLNSEHLGTLDASYNYLNISDGSIQLSAINTLQTDGVSVKYRPQLAHVTGVQITNKPLDITTNDTKKLDAKVLLPTDCIGNTTVRWSSSNENVATINSEGGVTAVSSGTTIITVTTVDGGFVDTCQVTVTPRQYYISTSANNASCGSVSGGGMYTNGYYVTLTATPNPGYRFVRWLQNGTEVSKSSYYTFIVSNESSLVAEFTGLSPIRINCSKTDASIYSGANGSVNATASGGDSGSYEYSINGGTNWQSNGSFGGLSAGTYTVLVRDARYPSNTATCQVSIDQPAYVGTVPANKISPKASVDTAVTVKPPAAPKGYTTQTVTYSSSNPAVAAVDANGNVTFISGGKVTITTTTVCQKVDAKGKVTTKKTVVKKTITVIQAVSSITLSTSNAVIAKKGKITIAANVQPGTATNKKVKWVSSNPKIASVSAKGVVTGKAAGTAIISCISQDGSRVSASCTVTVRP